MIAYRNWTAKVTYYVSEVPGDGGKDWGYTTDSSKAISLNTYWRRRFAADCRRVGSVAQFFYA